MGGWMGASCLVGVGDCSLLMGTIYGGFTVLL